MPRIANETIQRVAEANDIVEVINDYFPLKRAGTMWRALCPFHREKTPSFNVNPQRQMYKCFGCGAGGSVIRFVMEYEHLDFVEAVRKLAQRAGIPIIEEVGGPEDSKLHKQEKRLRALHVEAAAWFHHNLLRMPSAQVARDYLKSRGIGVEVAKSWQIGFAPDSWDALLNFLRERKFHLEEILLSGLAATRDQERNAKPYARFRGRVMFPIRNDYGEVIAFSGRVLDPEAKTAKYVNSPETPIFKKGEVLFGIDKSKRAIIEAKTAIVCEGQLDLISVFESGVQNIIAPQGTAFTVKQARTLHRLVRETGTVILCFDSDRAGQEAVNRSMPALLENHLSVKVARLPSGQDPDSLIRTRGAEAFLEVINGARNFFDDTVDREIEEGALKDPGNKDSAAKRLGPLVAAITKTVEREATKGNVCARLQIPVPVFEKYMIIPHEIERSSDKNNNEEPLKLAEGIRQLCRLAILSSEARAWLASQGTPHPKELGDGGHFLAKILASPLGLEEHSARAAFASGLNAREELTLFGIDLDRPPENALPLAQNLWLGLAAAVFRHQRDAAAAQLRQTNLSGAERLRLQTLVGDATKQILDLQSRLNEV